MFKRLILFVCLALCACSGRSAGLQPILDPGWQGTTPASVCLAASLAHPDFDEYNLPLQKTAARILESLGITVMKPGEACDASLQVDMTVDALSDTYFGIGCGGTLYTGARVDGTVTLQQVDLKHAWPFEEMIEPASHLSDKCPENPLNAPIGGLWQAALVSAFTDIWGTPAAILSLQDKEMEVRQAGVLALFDHDISTLSNQELALVIPGFIRALKEDYPRVDTSDALQQLTGQDFSEDAGQWSAWWRKNKQSYQ